MASFLVSAVCADGVLADVVEEAVPWGRTAASSSWCCRSRSAAVTKGPGATGASITGEADGLWRQRSILHVLLDETVLDVV